MYLKEISTTGFKSFAEKISITLDDKITCIVGPNGSGKSNIVDAVRWVLGEQSVKSLRGDSAMSDVIFGGSKSRKPLNVASVTLIFDNSDHYLNVAYTEVSVKRRVYRTGENEYFLNGEKCRLKDITDLFMDSGIGKESFNIISQGEVMNILSTSPTDRRIIFEEAAGVLKYKKRKEEALRKLSRTNDNIDRANDIILELENQLEPLKEQSKKAKEYLENKEGLDKYEVALIAYDITELNEKYQNIKEKINHLEEEILYLSNTSVQKDASLMDLKNQLLKIENKIKEENQLLIEISSEVEKQKGEVNLLKERSKYDSNDPLVIQNLRNLLEEKTKVETNLYLIDKELEDLIVSDKQNKETINSLRKELDEIKIKRQHKENDYQYQTREIISLEQQISVKNDFIEQGGNIPLSIKKVLNNHTLEGIHNTLGNLINIDEKYSKALEVSLTSSKFFVVVDDDFSAKEAINYLKNEKLGRATFFPLSTIKPKGIDEVNEVKFKESLDYISTLDNLLKYDLKYRNIILNQFGNVVVANDLNGANRLSKMCNNRYKIVTLDGDVIHVGGSLTGGSFTKSKSIVSEKIELNRLKETLTIKKELAENLTNEINIINEEIKNKEEKVFDSLKQENLVLSLIENKNSDKLKVKDKLLSLENEYNSLSSLNKDSIVLEEEKLIKIYYEKEKEKQELLSNHKQLLKKQEKLKEEILEKEALEKIQNASRHKKEQQLKTLEIDKSKIDFKLDHLLEELSENYSMTYEKAKKDYELDIEVDEARRKVNLYKNAIKNLGMVNLDSINEFERVNSRYEFLTSQRSDLLNAKDTLLEIIKEMDQVMTDEFSKTFELIKLEFNKVFKELFKGGQADLKLTDPSDILQTGVEIIASPPGKKMTTISLLSGGEKTLTAISLLFAILNIRTVPFCLFDEVEAALDEANVDQFGKYLDHYKNKTQFLIITHKKKTMEYADTLYGITMQESGVSKLVSVKLTEEKTI